MSEQKKHDMVLIIETMKRAEMAGVNTIAQLTVLTWIAAKGGLKTKELISLTGFNGHSVSTICNRLAVLKLVSCDKIYGQRKRYEKHWDLTPLGQKAAERVCR
jgi:DNA-binding IclR family transcriptional regulator